MISPDAPIPTAPLDPMLCRTMANVVRRLALTFEDKEQIAEQLTAAADLAVEHDRWCAELGAGWLDGTPEAELAKVIHERDAALRELAERPTLTDQQAREVVRTSAMTGVCEAVGRLMGPTYWHDNPSAHGTFECVANDIATRAAKELAGVVVELSEIDRQTLQMIRDLVGSTCGATELLDRLLAGPVVDPAQREADLREAFLAGAAWMAGAAEPRSLASPISTSDPSLYLALPADERGERVAAEYARSKAGA